MELELWKTTVLGVGPWIVSDIDDPSSACLGSFRLEKHARIFLDAMEKESDDEIKRKAEAL